MPFMEYDITEKRAWVSFEDADGGTSFCPQEYYEPHEDHSDVQTIQGYGVRLNAPGYMDCTDWAVFDTAEKAQAYLEEMYPEEEDDEDPCGCAGLCCNRPEESRIVTPATVAVKYIKLPGESSFTVTGENETPVLYNIVRTFRKSGRRKILHRRVTLEVARLHCNDSRTSKAGVYFDGFEAAK